MGLGAVLAGVGAVVSADVLEGRRSWAIVCTDALERARRLEEALRLFVDDEECRYDHHGYCQEHGVTMPCRNAVARALLGEDPP